MISRKKFVINFQGPDNDLSKSSWDYEKKFTDDKDVYGVVKNVPEDYFFATTPRYYCNELVEFPRVHRIATYLV